MNALKWIQKKLNNQSLYRLDVFSPVAQEDTRDQATKKRVRSQIEAQQQQMQARALKRHSWDCKDPLTCTKDPCWVWEPDIIIGEPVIEAVKTKEQRKKQ
jgi:hypothetical protein